MSLCAIVGGEGLNTIKLPGMVQKQSMDILVDSRSTHSFLDPKLLSQLRKELEKTKPLLVIVANGEQMVCDSICQGLSW